MLRGCCVPVVPATKVQLSTMGARLSIYLCVEQLRWYVRLVEMGCLRIMWSEKIHTRSSARLNRVGMECVNCDCKENACQCDVSGGW
jgi:hypothetical protein